MLPTRPEILLAVLLTEEEMEDGAGEGRDPGAQPMFEQLARAPLAPEDEIPHREVRSRKFPLSCDI